MLKYLQLQRTNAGTINTNEFIIFDSVPVVSGGGYITHQPADGTITFTQEGIYYVNWFVAQQTGLAADGSNFAIVPDQGTMPSVRGSNHLKISQTSGFAILEVPLGGAKIILSNVSNASVALSQTAQVKAGIAVFCITEKVTPTPEVQPLGYMQARASAGVDPIFSMHDTIIAFQQIVDHDPDMIIQHAPDMFTLTEAGVYLVKWDIPVMATETSGSVNITLTLDGTSHTVSYMPLPIGVLSGSAIITADTAGKVLRLKNYSTSRIQISPYANISIVQLSHIEVPEP